MVLIIFPFALGYYVSYLLRSVNAVVSPSLTGELGLSASDLGLLTSSYFVGFGLVQIPLGIALDKYGPKRVEAVLLLVAAAGVAAFAVGHSMISLTAARFLIGLGVSACLMAALKGISLWYPAEKQGAMSAFVMAAGALGALSASKPVQMLLPILGWRGVFWTLTGLVVFTAVIILRSIPEHVSNDKSEPFTAILKKVWNVFISRAFFKFAPATTFFPGGFMAIQTLWAVPWFMNVEGYTLSNAAISLMLLNCGMLIGQLFVGFAGGRLVAKGYAPLTLMKIGYGLFLLIEILILLRVGQTRLLWVFLGIFAASNSQTYISASECFPKEMFGRVVTAFNLMSFAGAFVIQWGMGIILDGLQSRGYDLSRALMISFGVLIIIQIFSYFALYRKNGCESIFAKKQ